MQIQRGAALISENTSKSTNHAIQIIFHENKFAHTREHFKEHNMLNIYQLNIFNNFLFATSNQNGKVPNVFLSKFLRTSYHYPTSFS